MKDGPDIARVAALIGDPARANMLVALMSGKALTATELAAEAGVTAQTASSHLARLREGGLLSQRKRQCFSAGPNQETNSMGSHGGQSETKNGDEGMGQC